MIFMKGPECDDEIAEARETRAGVFQLAIDRAYVIPGTTHQRRLLVYERLEGEAPPRPRSRAVGHAATFGGAIREITSTTNPLFKRCRDILAGPGIRKHGEAILAGSRIRDEVLARYPDHVIGWLTDVQGAAPPMESIAWLRLSDSLFKELDIAGDSYPAPPGECAADRSLGG